jgi:hypothetical protein
VTTALAEKPSFLQSKIGGLPRPFWALWSGTLVNGITIVPSLFTSVPLHSAQKGRGRPPIFDCRKEGFSASAVVTGETLMGFCPTRERFSAH